MAEKSNESYLVSFKNVSVKRGESQVILKETEFNLPVNGIYALCGPSGCGKSTVCQIIKKSISISSGSVLYMDEIDVPGNDIGESVY